MIIISSIAGYNPEQGLTMYGVTKTALFGLTKVYVYLFFFSFFTLFAVTDFCSSLAIFHCHFSVAFSFGGALHDF